jgi:hypothetical protein
VARQLASSAMIPAASCRSNMGMPNISQYVLRGCGSSVYSMPSAQSLFKAIVDLPGDLLVAQVGQE